LLSVSRAAAAVASFGDVHGIFEIPLFRLARLLAHVLPGPKEDAPELTGARKRRGEVGKFTKLSLYPAVASVKIIPDVCLD
jgi:hypothetical protein